MAALKIGAGSSRWLLYLLECADGTLYTGITTDLPRRLRQHGSGTASRYTRSRLPVRLVYREACSGHSAALRRELEVKRLPRQAKAALAGLGVCRRNGLRQ